VAHEARVRRRLAALRAGAALLVVVASVLAGPAAGAGAVTGGAATTDSAPVDLATPVDLADGRARPPAIVRAGDARFEVLSPLLIRLEYSPSGRFEDRPSVNAVDRDLPVPRYRTTVSRGWITIRTRRALLRYRLGSGPFTPDNTTVRFTQEGGTDTVRPAWEWECTFGQVCQSGSATLTGGAALGQGSSGYLSTAGAIGNLLSVGAGATWSVLGAPAGPADLVLRYSTYPLAFHPGAPHTLQLSVDGHTTTIGLVPTALNQWADVTTTVALHSGTNQVGIGCGSVEGCGTNVDTLSVAAAGTPVVGFGPTGPLGGWIRGFDTDTYNETPTCTPGAAPDTCTAGIEPLHTDGLLDRAGWRLLDDTDSAVWTGRGWVHPRTSGGDIEDGYLFVYGHDYTGALRTLAALTGPAPLPPRDVFGVWYSDYTPYSAADIEDTVYPAFTANHVPLDTQSLDTDWKAPDDWNGWEWNPTLFPDPGSFLGWARHRGIDVTLNIHSSIDDNDPAQAAAERIAGHTLAPSSCPAGPCTVWDWSSVPQAESNFSLQQPLERQGVAFWWLDWCCDASVVSMPGLTPDAWIDHLYAQEMDDRGQRGFVLARIGSSNADPEQVYPAGPWSDHTSAIAFTGDAWGTWNTLATEAALAPDEATIGEPYVSDDIGSFLGPPPTMAGADPPDLYDRWVQLGTFQPVLRLHSDDEDRLPWQFPQPVQGITEAFLRLRGSLLPYTYTLADDAHQTGLPMTRPLYLDDPGQAGAYTHPTEYLYGPDMLVAPVTTPGTVADTTVWFPPGRWVDYFTGGTVTGPATVTLAEPLDRMPIFVRAGGIVPEEQPTAGGPADSGPGALDVHVYGGGDSTFTLYDDAGTGTGFRRGQRTETPMATSYRGATDRTLVTVGAARGHYPGEPTRTTYRFDIVDLARPAGVERNGHPLPEQTTNGSVPGWSYDPGSSTVTVDAGAVPADRGVTILVAGAAPVQPAEPGVTAVPAVPSVP